MPKSAGDVLCSTSLMRSIKELYPDFELYFATERKYFDLLKGNPFIDKIIEYKVEMNNIFYSEGSLKDKGEYEIAYLPFLNSQAIMTYQHNDHRKIAYEITTFKNSEYAFS
jgi:ADP-heptose:LPS heptosyltransferase